MRYLNPISQGLGFHFDVNVLKGWIFCSAISKCSLWYQWEQGLVHVLSVIQDVKMARGNDVSAKIQNMFSRPSQYFKHIWCSPTFSDSFFTVPMRRGLWDEIYFAVCGSPFGQPFVYLNVSKWWKVQCPWEGHLKPSENNFICKKQNHDPFPISMGIFSPPQWPTSLRFVKLILCHTKAIFSAVSRLQEGLTSRPPSHAVFWSVP